MSESQTHHAVCAVPVIPGFSSVDLVITVGHREDGSLQSAVRFPTGDVLVAKAGDPDLGFTETDNVLHDVAHTLLAACAGLSRSPVLERVVDLRPLSQQDVDLEEAAVFALQAWCASLRGEDYLPAVRNLQVALGRLVAEEA